MHVADIDLQGFREVHAKATIEARNNACPALAIWRQDIGPFDPAGLLRPLFERSTRTFVWVSPETSVIAMGSATDFTHFGRDRFAGIRRGWEKAARTAVADGPGA